MIEWARKKARKISVVLTIARSWKSSETRHGKVILGCEQHGRYRTAKKGVGVDVDTEKEKRKGTNSKKKGCPFLLVGWEDRRNEWVIKVEYGRHSHGFPPTLEGHAFAGRLTDEQMADVAIWSASGSDPKTVWQNFQLSYEDNVTSRQQIYNARAKIKRSLMAGKSAMQYLWALLQKLGYIYAHRLTEDHVLQDLIFAHPESLRLWEMYSYVMIMDATYKTNRYIYMLYMQICYLVKNSL